MMVMYHMLMMFMHILSKRFSAAGLRDALKVVLLQRVQWTKPYQGKCTIEVFDYIN